MGNNEYQSSIDLIDEVEHTPQEKKVITLNVREVFAKKVDLKKYSDNEAMRAIDEVASLVPYNSTEDAKSVQTTGKDGTVRKMGRFAGSIEKKAMESRYMSLAEKEFKSISSRPNPKSQKSSPTIPPTPQAPVQQQAVPETQKSRETPVQKTQPSNDSADIEKAAAEMQAAIPASRSADLNMPKMEVQPNQGNLVLPTLPLPEQIAELEKIDNGLDRNIFNKEQLKVIREEVTGLMASTKGSSAATESEKQLAALRDQGLSSVMKKLR